MNIKNTFLSLLFLLVTSMFSFAQFTNVKVSELEKLKQSGTLVVAISDDETTNKAAEEIMAAYWKASKYKVIKASELEGYVKTNPENYVITYVMNNAKRLFVMSNTQMASKVNGSTRTRSASIGDGLMLTKNVKKINKLKPTDAMIYCFIDPDMDLLNEKAEFIRQVGAINSILMYPNLKDNQIGGWKIPTIDQKEIIAKELWIAEEDLNKKSEDESKMKAAYKPYSYKVVSKEEITKAIIEKKDIVYVARAEYQEGAFMFVLHSATDNRTLFFMAGTGGFDIKALEKIKNNKTYGQ
jgi:hypothetical protein